MAKKDEKDNAYFVKEIHETQEKLAQLKKEYCVYLNENHSNPTQATPNQILEFKRKQRASKTPEQRAKEAEKSVAMVAQTNKK